MLNSWWLMQFYAQFILVHADWCCFMLNSCWLMLNSCWLMLFDADWCCFMQNSCWLMLISCWFVQNSCWLMLSSCWFVLICEALLNRISTEITTPPSYILMHTVLDLAYILLRFFRAGQTDLLLVRNVSIIDFLTLFFPCVLTIKEQMDLQIFIQRSAVFSKAPTRSWRYSGARLKSFFTSSGRGIWVIAFSR